MRTEGGFGDFAEYNSNIADPAPVRRTAMFNVGIPIIIHSTAMPCLTALHSFVTSFTPALVGWRITFTLWRNY